MNRTQRSAAVIVTALALTATSTATTTAVASADPLAENCQLSLTPPAFTGAGRIGITGVFSCENGSLFGIPSIAPGDRIRAMGGGIELDRFNTDTGLYESLPDDDGFDVDTIAGPGTITLTVSHICDGTTNTIWRSRWLEAIAEYHDGHVYEPPANQLNDVRHVVTLNCG